MNKLIVTALLSLAAAAAHAATPEQNAKTNQQKAIYNTCIQQQMVQTIYARMVSDFPRAGLVGSEATSILSRMKDINTAATANIAKIRCDMIM